MMSNDAMLSKIPEYLAPATPEEQALLELYTKVKQFEREAAVAKAEAAKAKLDAANEEFRREAKNEENADFIEDGIAKGTTSTTSKKKSRKKRRRTESKSSTDDANIHASSDEVSFDGSEGDLTDTDDEENHKIAQLREEHDELVQRQEREEASAKAEEELRQQVLEGNNAFDVGGVGSLRKKRDQDMFAQDKKETSLISNLSHMSTPPHEFSKKLGMSKVTGTQLFPSSKVAALDERKWTPPETASSPEEGCLELELNEFDGSKVAVGSGKNTIAIKFTAPSDSKRFSINIAEPNHENYYSVLFHFNPRQFERGGQVVINDKKAGMWGQSVNVPISTLPLMFGEVACTLIIQINGDGFDVYMNDQHCARLEHRTPLPDKSRSLILQLPSTDDYGNRENWSVHKVWWGHKRSMAGSDLSNIPGVNSHKSVHEKKLFVSGLQKISSQAEVDLRRAELERAFRKYGGQQGVTVICPPNCTFAFVEVETERAADLALAEMSSKYRVNRARRSRHEALLEQRAKAASKGITTEASEWD